MSLEVKVDSSSSSAAANGGQVNFKTDKKHPERHNTKIGKQGE